VTDNCDIGKSMAVKSLIVRASGMLVVMMVSSKLEIASLTQMLLLSILQSPFSSSSLALHQYKIACPGETFWLV